MNDSISRQAAIAIVEFECGDWTGLAKTIVKEFEQLPPAGPEIIRCKDCKWWKLLSTSKTIGTCNMFARYPLGDSFCDKAERKDNG